MSAAAFARTRQVISRAIAERVTPGAAVEVGTSHAPLWQHADGGLTYEPDARPVGTDTIYDLASLTKVLSATALTMRLVERGVIDLDDRVSTHLPRWTGRDRDDVRVADLLAHASGLPAHRPLYRTLRGGEAFEHIICTLPLEYAPRSRAVYSDLGFILLGRMLEAVAPLDVQFQAMRAQMGLVDDVQYRPPEIWRRRTAPTRLDPWRGRLLTGEVDDDNAYALGGVAAHAGLFGTAAAVGAFARHLLQILDGRVGFATPATVVQFTSRWTGVPGSSRALGWDTMRTTSSCGTRMSPHAFGHTGFTGTSLWIDPEQDRYVVLLTNRIHPQPEGDAITALRRAVHDAVADDLGSPPA